MHCRDQLHSPAMLRLVQLSHPSKGRRVAAVEEPRLRLLPVASIYELAGAAIRSGAGIESSVAALRIEDELDYDRIYNRNSDWSLVSPIDHPAESSRCFVTG